MSRIEEREFWDAYWRTWDDMERAQHHDRERRVLFWLWGCVATGGAVLWVLR